MARALDWLEERVGYRGWARGWSEEQVQGGARWRYTLGPTLVYLFVQQVALGILLASYYSPSATDAWASTAYLNDQVTGGWFLRGLHHHGMSAMVVVAVLHTIQVVLAGAYKRPRELNWWTGLALGGIVLGFSITGYTLPWDQNAYWSVVVRAGIVTSVPGGEWSQQLLQGGRELGNLTLTRFYALHVFVLPLLLVGLLWAHVRLRRRHGVTPPAGLSEEALVRTREPLWPRQVFMNVVAMTICGGALLAATISSHGAPLMAPADPASNYMARPEWFFLGLFQLLKYFNGPLRLVGAALIPGAAAVFLLVLPFLDRAPTRRLRSRVGALSGVAALMTGLVTLTALAVAEDAGKESYAAGVAAAQKDAARARELALAGVGPRGGVAVWENDPEFQALALFQEHCATCHTLRGKGGEEAPSFDDWGSRAWMAAFLRAPNEKRFYGGTKAHHTMEPLSAEDLPEEELMAAVEYVLSLRGDEAGALDAGLVKRGQALWEEKLECSGCHEVEAGKEGTGPTLAGHGSRAWLERMIVDPTAVDLYGEGAEMPKFGAKLSAAEISTLAGLIAVERADTL
ncbi:MAG: cytochrome b N-terminal domain-containing protein [Nannocystis sp.]|nr:cytochrome b N-terminal domain-containing protein [Nannocystis sp.]